MKPHLTLAVALAIQLSACAIKSEEIKKPAAKSQAETPSVINDHIPARTEVPVVEPEPLKPIPSIPVEISFDGGSRGPVSLSAEATLKEGIFRLNKEITLAPPTPASVTLHFKRDQQEEFQNIEAYVPVGKQDLPVEAAIESQGTSQDGSFGYRVTLSGLDKAVRETSTDEGFSVFVRLFEPNTHDPQLILEVKFRRLPSLFDITTGRPNNADWEIISEEDRIRLIPEERLHLLHVTRVRNTGTRSLILQVPRTLGRREGVRGIGTSHHALPSVENPFCEFRQEVYPLNEWLSRTETTVIMDHHYAKRMGLIRDASIYPAFERLEVKPGETIRVGIIGQAIEPLAGYLTNKNFTPLTPIEAEFPTSCDVYCNKKVENRADFFLFWKFKTKLVDYSLETRAAIQSYFDHCQHCHAGIVAACTPCARMDRSPFVQREAPEANYAFCASGYRRVNRQKVWDYLWESKPNLKKFTVGLDLKGFTFTPLENETPNQIRIFYADDLIDSISAEQAPYREIPLIRPNTPFDPNAG